MPFSVLGAVAAEMGVSLFLPRGLCGGLGRQECRERFRGDGRAGLGCGL